MKNKKWYVVIPIIIVVGFLLWYFSSIVAYILISAVLSIIGQPIIRLLDNFKLGRFSIPRVISALVVLISMIMIVFLVFWLIIPMIATQANMLSGINVETISNSFREPIDYMQHVMVQYNLISPNENIADNISSQLLSVVGMTQFSNFINSIVSFTSSMAVAVFSISFITFFFLKDDRLFFKMIMGFTPNEYQSEVKRVLIESKRLLTRYFVGLCMELIVVVCLITLGMWILGLKNALMIGFFAGIMNIIPYAGPVIGGAIGILFGLTYDLGMDFSSQMIPLILKMISVFVIVNLIDEFVLQPLIFSNSVRAHPLEIFLVILIAGSVAGIPGMMLAIPSYTVLRIIAKEFFNNFYLVKNLTKNIDK
ncbi:MAG TPA: AI-2E family transporter [Bacteroidales bacterium]|nr:AI-2E family transporter [Bacteroidales bacterium]